MSWSLRTEALKPQAECGVIPKFRRPPDLCPPKRFALWLFIWGEGGLWLSCFFLPLAFLQLHLCFGDSLCNLHREKSKISKMSYNSKTGWAPIGCVSWHWLKIWACPHGQRLHEEGHLSTESIRGSLHRQRRVSEEDCCADVLLSWTAEDLVEILHREFVDSLDSPLHENHNLPGCFKPQDAHPKALHKQSQLEDFGGISFSTLEDPPHIWADSNASSTPWNKDNRMHGHKTCRQQSPQHWSHVLGPIQWRLQCFWWRSWGFWWARSRFIEHHDPPARARHGETRAHLDSLHLGLSGTNAFESADICK